MYVLNVRLVLLPVVFAVDVLNVGLVLLPVVFAVDVFNVGLVLKFCLSLLLCAKISYVSKPTDYKAQTKQG